jgi:tRNA pseudouridine(55) synthase
LGDVKRYIDTTASCLRLAFFILLYYGVSMSRSRRQRRRAREKSIYAKVCAYARILYKKLAYPAYILTTKHLGETPLEALERLRTAHKFPKNLPLAYAGRLDPMATGALLILVGDTCKNQTRYHELDKSYDVELLFGVHSDSGDVLGLVHDGKQTIVTRSAVEDIFKKLIGDITLTYPQFSAKTVHGKPLHTWAVEKRIDEITIPEKSSRIYSLQLKNLITVSKKDILKTVREKVDSIPTVTDTRKRAGADFRRVDVRASWDAIEAYGCNTFQVLSFTCIASSGTYMRSLAEHIAEQLHTYGLALSIHRTTIGQYKPITKNIGFWTKSY